MTSIEIMDPRQLQQATQQPRSKLGDVRSLVEGMRATIFHSAILAEQMPDGRKVVRIGARRHAAAVQAGLEGVPVLVVHDGDIDPATMLAMQIRENRDRAPLPPTDEGLALIKLKLLMDCLALAERLSDEVQVSEDKDNWQLEYARLARLASEQGLKLAVPNIARWQDVEELVGISEEERHRLVRLGSLGDEVREALAESSLGLRHQLAVADAPPARQLELISAAITYEEGLPVLVIEAAARALVELPTSVNTAEVLTLAERLAQEGSTKKSGALAELVAAKFGNNEEMPRGSTPRTDGDDAAVALPVQQQYHIGDTEAEVEIEEGEGKADYQAEMAVGVPSARPVALDGQRRKGNATPAEGIIGEVADAAARIIEDVKEQLRVYIVSGKLDAARQFLDALTSGLDDAYMELSN